MKAGGPASRLHRVPTVVLALAVVLGLAGGCAGETQPYRSAPTTIEVPPPTPTVAPTTSAPAGAALSPLAALIQPAGSTLYRPPVASTAPRPVRLSVAGVGVRDAPVIEVGVDDKGELAVPGVREVGWYRFAARPGDAGSSVLAAHIAFDGVDGVFRRLADVRDGATVSVAFEDGAVREFAVSAVQRIDKDELPPSLFSTTGPSQLVLITCGGAFDNVRRSYEDNIVVIARPV